MSLTIEEECSANTLIIGNPSLSETLIEQDGLTILVQDEPSSSVLIQHQVPFDVVLQNAEGNEVLIMGKPCQSMIFDLGLSTVPEERQEIYIGVPEIIPSYPIIVFNPVMISGQLTYALQVNVP